MILEKSAVCQHKFAKINDGTSVICFAMIDTGLAPENVGSPVSISYPTRPSE